MAARRMFSKRVTESTRFIKMPATSQALYFHLGMNADDDGIVEAYQVMRSIGSTEDDLRVIVSKGFATVLNEDMVTYLNDWRENNSIRADRKIDSIYKELLLNILPDADLVTPKPSYYLRQKAICQTNDGQTSAKCPHRLGKDRLCKDKNNNSINTVICPEPEAPDRPSVISLLLNDKTEYPVYQEDINNWAELYPAVDVLQELRKMKGWLDANPERRKTKRGIKRFINSWLSKEQDRNSRAYTQSNTSSHTITETERARLEAERIANRPEWMKNLKYREPREDDPFK